MVVNLDKSFKNTKQQKIQTIERIHSSSASLTIIENVPLSFNPTRITNQTSNIAISLYIIRTLANSNYKISTQTIVAAPHIKAMYLCTVVYVCIVFCSFGVCLVW